MIRTWYLHNFRVRDSPFLYNLPANDLQFIYSYTYLYSSFKDVKSQVQIECQFSNT